jgi:hypothetical protein
MKMLPSELTVFLHFIVFSRGSILFGAEAFSEANHESATLRAALAANIMILPFHVILVNPQRWRLRGKKKTSS